MAEPFLKQYIWNLSVSPEAFLSLRSEFCKSWACVSVASYILGIGDRHLDNFLLNLSSGSVIAIDFGHAFGSATEIQSIPELVPVRLTPQIVKLIEPLGPSALLEPLMTDAMAAARNSESSGIDAPFIEMGTPQTTPLYSVQRLEIAQRKLRGEHPRHVMAIELERGHAHKAFFANAKDVLLSNGSDKDMLVDGAAEVVCQSVQEQIMCLIDHATDIGILGRAWIGWGSWC
eukprot:jgi/Hompol1/6237/HPOL_004896-RA